MLALIRCHILQQLIWVYTVYSGLSVPISRVISVHLIPNRNANTVISFMTMNFSLWLIILYFFASILAFTSISV